MQTQRQAWKLFQQYHVASFVVSSCMVAVLGLGFVDNRQQANVEGNSAQIYVTCSQTNRAHIRSGSDAPENVAASDRIADVAYLSRARSPLLTESNQPICVSGNAAGASQDTPEATKPLASATPVIIVTPISPTSSSTPPIVKKRAVPVALVPLRFWPINEDSSVQVRPLARVTRAAPAMKRQIGMAGRANAFPYGQCTWWADQRYHQLHGVYVPWTTNANAAQWSTRAQEYGWRVSRTPTVGSIIVLQAGVEGAFGMGHVGVVEKVLKNGSVIVSSMNWGAHRKAVTDSLFRPGPGVTFLSQL